MKNNINIPSYNLGVYTIPDTCLKDVCVDIGANVGDFTVNQASHFALVHYYEPYTPCYQRAAEKTSQLSNVVGWNEAVYESDDAVVSLVAHSNYDAGSNAIKTDLLNGDWAEEIQQVKTVSLPTILKRVGGHINYLKVDCETSEYSLFMNQDLTEIDYIGTELHWQIGEERYNDLITHVCKTHTCSEDLKWLHGYNREVTFTNKKLA